MFKSEQTSAESDNNHDEIKLKIESDLCEQNLIFFVTTEKSLKLDMKINLYDSFNCDFVQ